MESRQIILANAPRLLRSMLCRILGKMPALEIAGEVGDLSMLPSLINKTDAHWVIVSLSPEGKLPDSVQSLLAAHPAIGIVGIAVDESLIRIHRAGEVERATAALSLDQLAAALSQQQPALSAGGG